MSKSLETGTTTPREGMTRQRYHQSENPAYHADGRPKKLTEATSRDMGELIMARSHYIDCDPESSGDLKTLQVVLTEQGL